MLAQLEPRRYTASVKEKVLLLVSVSAGFALAAVAIGVLVSGFLDQRDPEPEAPARITAELLRDAIPPNPAKLWSQEQILAWERILGTHRALEVITNERPDLFVVNPSGVEGIRERLRTLTEEYGAPDDYLQAKAAYWRAFEEWQRASKRSTPTPNLRR